MYTKQQVIAKRLCGLAKFDKAVSYSSIEKIIKDAFKIHKEFNDTPHKNSDIWYDFSWAFGNAWRDIIRKKEKHSRDISDTANLDEMLSEQQLKDIAIRLGTKELYIPDWDRK